MGEKVAKAENGRMVTERTSLTRAECLGALTLNELADEYEYGDAFTVRRTAPGVFEVERAESGA